MQKTDLNVSPYYDDFTEGSNFHRVLFRPAFSVQARELTQMPVSYTHLTLPTKA